MKMRRAFFVKLALLPLLVGGCDESAGPLEPVAPETESTDVLEVAEAELLRLRTHFAIDGYEAAADQVVLERLYLHVGAIFLESTDGGADAVAFANRQPFELDFDVASGVTQIAGPDLLLPYGGSFHVSVQVEPSPSLISATKADADSGASAVAEGLWFPSDMTARDTSPYADEPSPLPWRPKHGMDDADFAGIDFSYRSEGAIRIHLATISLDNEGDYELALNLHLEEWISHAVLPALVDSLDERRRPDASSFADTLISFNEPVDTRDDGGLAGLLADIGVTTRRTR